jgi:hypothetical protein
MMKVPVGHNGEKAQSALCFSLLVLRFRPGKLDGHIGG